MSEFLEDETSINNDVSSICFFKEAVNRTDIIINFNKFKIVVDINPKM